MLLVPEKVVRSELAMDRCEAFGISYCFRRCFHLGLIQEAKVCVACAHHEPEAFTDRVLECRAICCDCSQQFRSIFDTHLWAERKFFQAGLGGKPTLTGGPRQG